MTVYAETSAVLRWLFAEEDGEALRSVLAADVLAVFAQAASTWAILEITQDIARRAEDVFPLEPVRTLDAIHLASALFLRESFADLEIVTVDERVRSNAAQLGF